MFVKFKPSTITKHVKDVYSYIIKELHLQRDGFIVLYITAVQNFSLQYVTAL